MISHPVDTSLRNDELTLRGIPSAIACGLNAGINVGEGKIVAVDGDNNGKPLTPGSDADRIVRAVPASSPQIEPQTLSSRSRKKITCATSKRAIHHSVYRQEPTPDKGQRY